MSKVEATEVKQVEEKRCPVCTKTKPIKEFNSQGKCCLECHRERNRQWRENNRATYRASQRASGERQRKTERHKKSQKQCQARWYDKNKESIIAERRRHYIAKTIEFAKWLIAYYAEHHCIDCGESDPLKLSFDHVRGKKSFNVSHGVKSHTVRRVIEETKKCDVRCMNCHAVKTAKERKFVMWRLLNNELD